MIALKDGDSSEVVFIYLEGKLKILYSPYFPRIFLYSLKLIPFDEDNLLAINTYDHVDVTIGKKKTETQISKFIQKLIKPLSQKFLVVAVYTIRLFPMEKLFNEPSMGSIWLNIGIS
jgi:hypothetical protein